MAKKRLNNEDFEIFCQECERIRSLLNLKTWEFLYDFGDLETGTRAEVSCDIAARTAIITLARSWEPIGLMGLFEYKVRETASHEVLHVFLAGIQDRECDRGEIDGRVHAAINTLQSLLTVRGRETQGANETNETSD